MNLYVKHRPESFEDVAGNKEVISYLQEVVADKKKCPKVFLFSGQTGTGKTTVARIVSKMLGCDELDYTEVNSANFRGIDTVRELIKTSRYSSLSGNARVWLIDEVHKMTGDAQNAMLKLLEDPPPKCYYILCTTEPNKLLPTVRGRCMQLQMQPLSDGEMLSALRRIARLEEKRVKRVVYEQIIQDSFGLSRNAIQTLDRVLSLPPEEQLEAAKRSSDEKSASIDLCRALLAGAPWKAVRNILKGLKDQEAEGIRRHILGYVESVLLNKEDDRAAFIIECFYEPLYDIGFPGLVYCCYSVTKG